MENRQDDVASSTSLSSSDDQSERPLDLTVDDGWEDAEPDHENLEFVSLVDHQVFSSVEDMLQHCKRETGFDLLHVVKRLELDFFGCMKLINYIRTENKLGNPITSTFSKDLFEDDKYLQPALQDDALLFSVDDILELCQENVSQATNGKIDPSLPEQQNADSVYIARLEEQLQRLQAQFADYRAAVAKTLDERWSDKDGSAVNNVASSSSAVGSRAPISAPEQKRQANTRDDDTHYFDSYAYNDIHETMLKDTIRTCAYRDFIYAQKHLFTNKTVIDVGCGTGILSMFSIKAGASQVFAVDNSDILSKARENIAQNNMTDKITCIRGKIEDVQLPSTTSITSHGDASRNAEQSGKVDIIVSEWMGYCLLYESMLDSVIHARDRFLNPTSGLMIPSHCTLHIAPVSCPDYIDDSIGFWSDVYGFDMKPMCEKIHDDVIVRSFPASAMPAESARFRTLPLHTISVGDLTFNSASFEVVLDRDIQALDGWAIWFDTFFLPSRDSILPDGARAETWPKDDDRKGLAFTTGPGGKETHWMAGLLTIDHQTKSKLLQKKAKKGPVVLQQGQKIVGSVAYRKRETNSRELEIDVEWDAAGTEERGRQSWHLR